MRKNSKYKCTSVDAEECIGSALSRVITTQHRAKKSIDQDGIHLENIRLLSRVRKTKTGMELRDRFIWSMTNLYRQISNTTIAKQAALIINTARNGDQP
ncbi:MAG: hypothetical protein RI964_827 [Pseudomonadota bacterium]|jgi:hypothetical protein